MLQGVSMVAVSPDTYFKLYHWTVCPAEIEKQEIFEIQLTLINNDEEIITISSTSSHPLHRGLTVEDAISIC